MLVNILIPVFVVWIAIVAVVEAGFIWEKVTANVDHCWAKARRRLGRPLLAGIGRVEGTAVFVLVCLVLVVALIVRAIYLPFKWVPWVAISGSLGLAVYFFFRVSHDPLSWLFGLVAFIGGCTLCLLDLLLDLLIAKAGKKKQAMIARERENAAREAIRLVKRSVLAMRRGVYVLLPEDAYTKARMGRLKKALIDKSFNLHDPVDVMSFGAMVFVGPEIWNKMDTAERLTVGTLEDLNKAIEDSFIAVVQDVRVPFQDVLFRRYPSSTSSLRTTN